MTRLYTLIGFLFMTFAAQGQDIPLFSQKLTNGFIYNPAMAGSTFGSVTLGYRMNYTGVTGAPTQAYLSANAPIANQRFGVGFNVFQEKVNIMQNTFASAAFAYHLHINQLNTVSMGVSGEYNMMRFTDISESAIQADNVLARYSNMNGQPDFSFGILYTGQYIKGGIAANRMSTAWFQSADARVLSNYYSAYLQGMIPLRGDQDLLEPYAAFRKFSETNSTYDIGVFYTYASKIMAGVSTRSGSVYAATLGYKVTPNLLIGYSGEMILGNLSGFTGMSHEFALRYDFATEARKERASSNYKNSLSYRRKTLNTSGVKKTSGGRTPKQLAKAQKRVSAYSPNKRYQNMSKLSGGRKSSGKKPSYAGSKSKKRKPVKRRR